MRPLFLAVATIVVVIVTSLRAENKPETVRVAHEVRQVEGWNVHVDKSLLEGEHKETGDLALKIPTV